MYYAIAVGATALVVHVLTILFYSKEISFGKELYAMGLKDEAAIKAWLAKAKALLP